MSDESATVEDMDTLTKEIERGQRQFRYGAEAARHEVRNGTAKGVLPGEDPSFKAGYDWGLEEYADEWGAALVVTRGRRRFDDEEDY